MYIFERVNFQEEMFTVGLCDCILERRREHDPEELAKSETG